MFIVRTVRNTQIHSVGRMQSFSIVTCIPIARQRLGKHISAATNTQATIEYLPLLCSVAGNTPLQQ
jgi:hypothetical protein